MPVIFATFYADVPGKASRAKEALEYALAGEKALKATTPAGRYIVLTDRKTAPAFDSRIDTFVTAPDDAPLMLKYMMAQRQFLRGSVRGLIVLADTDNIPNRDLTKATPAEVGLAITHKGAKFEYRINNLALSRDHDLTGWFLDKAIALLQGWPADQKDWLGDQESWEAVAGSPRKWVRQPGDIFYSDLPGRRIHLYPCDTHNCPVPRQGGMKQIQQHAYILHFKGPRKAHLEKFMAERFP